MLKPTRNPLSEAPRSRSFLKPRVLRVGGSLVIVLVAYWAYALVAVPLIEPRADPRQEQSVSGDSWAAGRDLIRRQLKDLVGLFPPDAWELDNPKILASSRVKLLMQDYRNLGDGRVKIEPCTMIFLPEMPELGQARQWRRAVILECPRGALLEFDEPFDLRRMRVGRLVGGRLEGPIRIRSQGKLPGPEDDLLIETSSVEMTEHHVWTSHPVDFRWGPNYGRGRHMHIKLLPADDKADGNRRGPNVGGIELFEMRQIEGLHLELPGAEFAPIEKGGDAAPVAAAANLSVEVTCRGPFRFDVIRQVATFEDRVNVSRVDPDGPSDQLHCELLSIFFGRRDQPAPGRPDLNDSGAGKARSTWPDLKPQRIEARGHPVVLSAPSRRLHGRGERLEYDLEIDRLVLDGSQGVMLKQDANEIHARSLDYQSAGPGRLGQIMAEGPGWLRGQSDRQPDQPLEASWNRQLQVRPHERNQVISLTGGAALKSQGIGRLEAPEIHLYLLESPTRQPSDPNGLRPDRMIACQQDQILAYRDGRILLSRKGRPPADPDAPAEPRHNVLLQSPQFSAAVEQLEIWFQQGSGGEIGRPRPEAAAPAGAATAGLQGQAGFPAPAGQPAASQPAPAARQHFEIVGRLLQASVRLQGDGQGELSELTIVEGVQFAETRTARPDQQPLLLGGDLLEVVDASTPRAAVAVVGTPAHFRGRGLALTGPNIHLNRGTNRLWIDGAGGMDLPIDRDLEGNPLNDPGVLEIRWQDRMDFDGQTARFGQSVTAAGPNQRLQTATLEVHMSRAVRFADDSIQRDPEATKDLIGQLVCRGGVFIENRQFDRQTQASYERMQLVDLEINRASGDLAASGPGWFHAVRRGSGDLLRRRDPTAADQNTPAADRRDDRLLGLHVRFQDRITGNVKQRRMTFHGQVQTAYAPVDSWQSTLEVNDPDALGPGGVTMGCDRLSVSELTTPLSRRRALELEAAGNLVVEGTSPQGTFTARAVRMTYAQAKDLLVLEGDGRTDAKLYRQQQVGAPTSEVAARKILFWPSTNQVNFQDARSLELSGFPAPAAGKW